MFIVFKKADRFLKKLGPGLITGASDDDPSGIATYSIAGARVGYPVLWSAFYSIPLMVSIQEMCARIGLVTGQGLAGVIRKHYRKSLLVPVVVLLLGANTLNIGADLRGMAASAALVVPWPSWILALVLAAVMTVAVVFFPYHLIARVMKWMTIFLLAYVATAFLVHQDWTVILFDTLVPHLAWDAETMKILVAVLGTTISPYLFFWIASEEVEEQRVRAPGGRLSGVSERGLQEMRDDTISGMVFSNVIMFFIIATTASLFHGDHLNEFSSVADVASALRPLAGNAAFMLFALGVVGTGFLAIPVLAASSAYALCEALGWKEGLSEKFHNAKAFYLVIIASVAIGFATVFFGIGAVYLLFATAIVYGLISPFIIAVVLHVANNKDVMGAHVNRPLSNVLGGLTFAVMLAAVIGLFVTGI